MFQLFRSRDKAVRIVLGAFLGLVGLSMVTYLIPNMGNTTDTNSDSSVVATIGKQDLTAQEVTRQIQNMTRNRQLPPELLSIYVPQIVQQMITDRAMAYEANRLGIRVSDDETENAIMDSLPAELTKGGKVDSATLNAMLQQQGVTMADLKEDTQRQLMISRLRQIVGEGIVVSPREIADEYHPRTTRCASITFWSRPPNIRPMPSRPTRRCRRITARTRVRSRRRKERVFRWSCWTPTKWLQRFLPTRNCARSTTPDRTRSGWRSGWMRGTS